jgi:hypothetical protein
MIHTSITTGAMIITVTTAAIITTVVTTPIFTFIFLLGTVRGQMETLKKQIESNEKVAVVVVVVWGGGGLPPSLLHLLLDGLIRSFSLSLLTTIHSPRFPPPKKNKFASTEALTSQVKALQELNDKCMLG